MPVFPSETCSEVGMWLVLAFSPSDSAIREACPWGWPAHLPRGWMEVAFGVSWGLKPTCAQPDKSGETSCGHSEEGHPVLLFFWPCCATCGIVVPRPGLEPRLRAVKARSPNH